MKENMMSLYRGFKEEHNACCTLDIKLSKKISKHILFKYHIYITCSQDQLQDKKLLLSNQYSYESVQTVTQNPERLERFSVPSF